MTKRYVRRLYRSQLVDAAERSLLLTKEEVVKCAVRGTEKMIRKSLESAASSGTQPQ